MAIYNRFNNTLNDFINSSNLKFLPRPINKKLCNTPISSSNATSFLKKNCLNKSNLASDKLS